MNELIVINVVTVFVLFIEYISYVFSQTFSKAGSFYGVSLPEEYNKDSEIISIQKEFRRLSGIIFAGTLVISIFLMYAAKIFAPYVMIISIFVELILLTFVYIKAHLNVKKYKELNVENINQSHKRFVDIDFMEQKAKLKKQFTILYVIPLLVIAAVTGYTMYKYPIMPKRIPVHWNFAGKPNRFVDKSYMELIISSAMQTGLVLLLAAVSIFMLSARTKLDQENIGESRNQAIKYLKRISASNFAMTLLIVGFFSEISLSKIKGTEISTVFNSVFLILILISCALMTYYTVKYNKKFSLKGKNADQYSPEDDDSKWILGTIYYNPNDPAFLVEKRHGAGWTINFGNTKGKISIVIFIVFIAMTIIMAVIS